MRARAGYHAIGFVLFLTLPAGGRALAVEPRVDPELGPLFARAVRDAAVRLERSGCLALLDELRGARSGAPLSRSLATTGLTPSGFVRSLHFRDGEGSSACAGNRIAAFTSPGSRVVFVCPGAFRGNHAPRGVPAHVVVLHETLHSLGLGEDPPNSWEITTRVRQRCGE